MVKIFKYSKYGNSLTSPSISEVKQVEESIKQLISSTHAKQEYADCVVKPGKGILLRANILVGCLAHHCGSVQVNPVA